MDTTQFAKLAALIAVMGTAVVYGTDVFCRWCCDPRWPALTIGHCAR